MIAASRRRFLAIIGATPIAAKAAADQAAGALIGMKTNGLGDASVGLGDGGMYGSAAKASGIPYEARLERATTHLKLFGIPDWLDDELRDQARYIEGLDPDLACKRSWSMSVKVAEQRARNYRRKLAHMETAARHRRGRTMLEKLVGFDWPW